MSYNTIVLVKQVPDTKAVSPRAMNPDGTLNRSVLPAILLHNPFAQILFYPFLSPVSITGCVYNTRV